MDCCDCAEWKTWKKIADGQAVYLHVHGFHYTGPVFRFCPFCGKELAEITPPAP